MSSVFASDFDMNEEDMPEISPADEIESAGHERAQSSLFDGESVYPQSSNGPQNAGPQQRDTMPPPEAFIPPPSIQPAGESGRADSGNDTGMRKPSWLPGLTGAFSGRGTDAEPAQGTAGMGEDSGKTPFLRRPVRGSEKPALMQSGGQPVEPTASSEAKAPETKVIEDSDVMPAIYEKPDALMDSNLPPAPPQNADVPAESSVSADKMENEIAADESHEDGFGDGAVDESSLTIPAFLRRQAS